MKEDQPTIHKIHKEEEEEAIGSQVRSLSGGT